MTAEDFRNALRTAEVSGKSEFRKLAEYSAQDYSKWPLEIRNKLQKPADDEKCHVFAYVYNTACEIDGHKITGKHIETHAFTSERDFVVARNMRVDNAFDQDGLKVAMGRDEIKRLMFVELTGKFADKDALEASLHEIFEENMDRNGRISVDPELDGPTM
ncbi:hypothetical protein [Gemmobacter nectariphilus]|uniref:hypothetical protein n=1 Tax=Gemmobacter nectariphilus TaxID=220343 RepID=UPI000484C73A|nr:hypothetical protein [Gemmobacter nectariphilus]